MKTFKAILLHPLTWIVVTFFAVVGFTLYLEEKRDKLRLQETEIVISPEVQDIKQVNENIFLIDTFHNLPDVIINKILTTTDCGTMREVSNEYLMNQEYYDSIGYMHNEAGISFWWLFLGLFGYKTKKRIREEEFEAIKLRRKEYEKLSKEAEKTLLQLIPLTIKDRIKIYKKVLRILRTPNAKDVSVYTQSLHDGYITGLCGLFDRVLIHDYNLSTKVKEAEDNYPGSRISNPIQLLLPEFVYPYGEMPPLWRWSGIIYKRDNSGKLGIKERVDKTPAETKAASVTPRIEYLKRLIETLEARVKDGTN